MRKIISKLIEPSIFIIVGVLTRILPHPVNFAPIAAMALFGGAYMDKKQAFTLPIFAMILSDFVIGFDSLPMRLIVYGSFSIMVLIGFWLKKHKNTKNVILATLFSSVLFFVLTNFSVWAFGTMYPKNSAGLVQSYVFAIPFFRNTLFGDLFYSGIFFGGYEFIRSLAKKSRFALES
jgi:hypothetical protein